MVSISRHYFTICINIRVGKHKKLQETLSKGAYPDVPSSYPYTQNKIRCNCLTKGLYVVIKWIGDLYKLSSERRLHGNPCPLKMNLKKKLQSLKRS